MARRIYLGVEFLLLFVAMPAGLAMWRLELILTDPGGWPGGIVPLMLVSTAILVFIVLLFDKSFDRRRLIGVRGMGANLRPVLLRFALLGGLMFGYMAWQHPDALFSFPRRAPAFWALVMLLYPVFSVLPQGVIWRAFLMHRYRPLFPTWPVMWLVAASMFSFAHVFFLNVEALVLTFFGGLMFVRTYRRSGSLVPSLIEHALYGCWAFTLGYGKFLYGGSVTIQP